MNMNLDFKTYLQRELVTRCQQNSQYSLRAFARTLGVDPSRLSKILKGQRPTNLDFIETAGGKLNLSIQTIEAFKAIEQQTKNATQETQQEIESKKKALQLTLDNFEVISDWQHYAILQLIRVEDFSPDAKWIAKSLDMSINEVNIYVERLQRVGLLTIGEDGTWTDTSNGAVSHVLGNNITSQAHRYHQKKLREESQKAIDDIDILFRDHSSRMIATSYKRIAEAKDMIKQFRCKLGDFLGSAEEKDTVYQLTMSLFPLSNKENFKTNSKLIDQRGKK